MTTDTEQTIYEPELRRHGILSVKRQGDNLVEVTLDAVAPATKTASIMIRETVVKAWLEYNKNAAAAGARLIDSTVFATTVVCVYKVEEQTTVRRPRADASLNIPTYATIRAADLSAITDLLTDAYMAFEDIANDDDLSSARVRARSMVRELHNWRPTEEKE